MSMIHLGLTVARKYRTRHVPDDMPRDAVLAALGVDESPWDDDTLRDTLRSIPEEVGIYDDAPRVLDISVSPDSTFLQKVSEITRIWGIHSATDRPTWISGDDAALVNVLASEWGCPIGAPDDVEATHYTAAGAPGDDDGTTWVRDVPAGGSGGPGGAGGIVGGAAMTLLMSLMVFMAVLVTRLHLHTSAGIDLMSRVMFDTSSTGTGSYAAANWIALTENATAPALGDTALTGELTGEGLARAQATYAHTNGTTTTTLTKTFTMSSGTSRTINKAGDFNASTVGTLAYTTAMPSPPTLVPGDSVAVTWTFTLS